MLEKIITWLKRPQVWGFFASMAIMAVISIAFFYPDNFEGNTLMQADTQQGAANGHEGQLYEQATGEKALWTNSLFSGMPTFQISPSYPSNALFTWLNGLYGLWLPAPSNLLFMMMFGFFIMMYCMKVRWPYALIGAVAWGFSSYFTILIGAGHIWKYLALTFIPPTIGGMVLSYRGRYAAGAALTALFAMLQLNANHPQMSYYFAFVMFGLAISYLIVDLRSGKARQWATATAVTILAGALAVGANMPSLYNTYEYAKETKRSQSELTPLAANETAPAERPTGGLPKSDIVNWSYGGSEMFTLLVPDVKGGASCIPQKGRTEIQSLDKLDGASDVDSQIRPLLGYFTQYFNDSESTNGPVYVGCIICALFLLGCLIVRGPMKWTLLVLTVLSALLALGRNFPTLTDFMIYNFPMYSKFRAVESILVIAEFTMPLLAVLALVQFFSAERPAEGISRPMLRKLCIAFGIPMFICIVGWLIPSIFGGAITSTDLGLLDQVASQSPEAALRLREAVETLRFDMVRSDCLRSFFLLLLAFAAMMAYLMKKAPKRWIVAIVGVLVLVDLYPVSKRYVNHDCFASTNIYAQKYNPFAPDAIDRAIAADTAQSYRVMDIPGFSLPNRSYHHKMIGGYHAAKLNRYEDLIQRRMQAVRQYGYLPELRDDSIAAEYPEEYRELIDQLRADYRVLDMLNARYIITGDAEAPVLINSSALGNAWLVDDITYVEDADAEMAALSTLDPAHQAVADRRFLSVLGEDVVRPVPGDTIRLTSYSPNRLTYHVETHSGGIGVFSEVWFPWGWKAEIDGKPAELGRVNYILRALRLPAGSHTVTMTFDPASIHTTSTVAYICVTIIYLMLIFAAFVAYTKAEAPAVSTKSGQKTE